MPPPRPRRRHQSRNRHHQAGQQHIVDAAMEGRRHPRQQRPRERSRQREREMAGRAGDVAIGIERAVNQRQSRLTQHPGPERKLADPPGSCACATSRCAQRRNEVPRGASAGARPPAIAAQAAARSGTRMRHDTPSTAR